MLARLHKLSWGSDHWFAGLTIALDGVDARQAAWQPPGGGNTIWQTLNHLNFYDGGILERLQGRPGTHGSNDDTFGEPGDPADDAGWARAVAEAHRIGAELQDALAALDEGDLDKPFRPAWPFQAEAQESTLEALSAWVLHDGYPTGQILLIRKQLGAWPAQRG